MKALFTKEFENDLKKIRDKMTQTRIKKIIGKILSYPDIGKPLSYELKGLRSVRISPYRIIYEISRDTIIFHKFEHRKNVYAA